MANEHTRRLRLGETVQIATGTRLMCCAGAIEVEGRVLRPGDEFLLQGAASVTALEGMRDEWLGESGIVVLYLSEG